MSGKKQPKYKLPKIPPFPAEIETMDLSQNTLLSTLLNDPASRAMVLQFMSQAQTDLNYKQEQSKKVENKLKQSKFTFDSPTAQFRRKALAQLDSNNSPARSDSDVSDATSDKVPADVCDNTECVPFNKLLRGLVIYVEVFSNGQDKSLSANALVQSMGAIVSDRIARGVTHVIFKDGSYQTYKLAKRLKMHVVSILWLQAVKRRGNLVPEKDYPAFSADQGDLNISTICKNLQSDFDEACQDERSKIINSSKINLDCNKTLVSTPKYNETIKNVSKPSTSHRKSTSDADDDDGATFLSAKSTTKSTASSTKLPSDLSSDVGQNLNDSLELTSNIDEPLILPEPSKNLRRRTIYNPENNTMIEINMSKNKRKTMFAIPVFKESNKSSTKQSNKENFMDLTCLDDSNNTTIRGSTNSDHLDNDNSVNLINTTARRSKTSLESNSSSNRSSLNSNSMDLTIFAKNRRRSVRIASKFEELFKTPISKDCESKDSSFSEQLSSLRLSTESNKRLSIDILNKRPSNEQRKVSFDNNVELQSENLTSSLRLSEDQQSNNKSSASELMGELSQLRIDATKHSIDMSSLQLSETPQKRLSDGGLTELSPPKKIRIENATKTQQNPSVSSNSASDSSGKKKSRRLYDADDPSNNEDLILQIKTVNLTKLVPKGQVKRAMVLVTKPFALTPDVEKGKLKSISTDSGTESDNRAKMDKTRAKKRLTKVRNAKETAQKAPVLNEDAASTSAGVQKSKPLFATPKTPKKLPSTPSRKSSRFATPVTYKQFYNDGKTSLDDSSDSNSSVITPKLNRRSTMDFKTPVNTTPKSLTQKGESNSKKGSAKTGIACTRFKVGRVSTFANIVRTLGRFHIDDNVIARTSHLVVGENKRTVNLLRAIARGCWILSADWLYQSMAARKWLPEEDYEFTDFSPAIQFCRKEREAFGATYTTDTFSSCGAIYIARRGTKPTGDELRELVRLAGGTVATVARSAAIVVGEIVRYDTVSWCVSELWVLDSITKNLVAEMAEYSLLSGAEVAGGSRERRLSEDY